MEIFEDRVDDWEKGIERELIQQDVSIRVSELDDHSHVPRRYATLDILADFTGLVPG